MREFIMRLIEKGCGYSMIDNAKILLEKMESRSHWIWNTGAEGDNVYVEFIKEFLIENVDKDAWLAISADTDYAVYINGKFVSCGQFRTFPEERAVDLLPSGRFLRAGINRMCILVYYQGESSMSYAKGRAGLRFYLENFGDEIVSDKSVLSSVSKSYHCGPMYKTTVQLSFGYSCDLSRDDGWLLPDYQLEKRFVESYEYPAGGSLVMRPVKKLDVGGKYEQAKICAQGYFLRKQTDGTTAEKMQSDYLSFADKKSLFVGGQNFPAVIDTDNVPPSAGVYVLVDLGREVCGYFTIDIECAAQTQVDIGYGEHLEDLRVRTYVGGRNFADSIVTRDGRQNFTYYFRRIAGRYIQVHFSNVTQLKIHYIGIKPVQYPVENVGHFVSEDSLHNKIYENCIETLRHCMHEHYEDCPWREQALYSFDSRNQALCGYYQFQEFTFAKASIRLLGQSVEEDGFIKICAPSDSSLKIPSFSMVWVLEAKEYLEYSKDTDFSEFALKVADKILSKAITGMKNGLAVPPEGENYWYFYEWTDGYDDMNGGELGFRKTEADFCDGMYQMFFYMALKSGEAIAEIAGNTELAMKYQQVTANLQLAINKIFWNEEKKLYSSYRMREKHVHYGEFMQALALFNGIACDPAATCRALMSGLENKITLSASIYKYEGLLKTDSGLLDYVLEDIKKIWGEMLFQGCSTFWETREGAGAFENAGSLCHGWSAIPLYIYLKYVKS